MTTSNAPKIHPERKKRVRRALTMFSIAAWITGILLLVLTGRMIADYVLHVDVPAWAYYIGQVHGIFYMVFVLAALNLGLKARWQPLTWVLTALAGVVPFLSFWIEYQRRKEVTAKFRLNED